MFKQLSTKLVNDSIQRDIIRPEQSEEYTYGINAFMTITLNIVSAIIIGFLLNMPLEIALFIVVFKFLRKYVGGSHASNAIRCYISSCAIYIVVLSVIKYYSFSSVVTVCLAAISALIMYLLAPVDAIKKPLDNLERKVFKKRAYLRITICFLMFILLHYTTFISKSYYLSIIIMVSMVTVSVFMISGKLKLIYLN